jgi:hypothetical protein
MRLPPNKNGWRWVAASKPQALGMDANFVAAKPVAEKNNND